MSIWGLQHTPTIINVPSQNFKIGNKLKSGSIVIIKNIPIDIEKKEIL